LRFSKKENDNTFSFDVFLDGKKQDDFKPKIETFINQIMNMYQ
jgi:diphosphomevalonate decarboxylase